MKTLLLLITLLWLPFANAPQARYQLSGNNQISIAGTSTLHDWTMDSKVVKGQADIELLNQEILSIREIKVEVPVESLKSGKSAMDKNAYNALKSEQYPSIFFQLKGFENIRRSNGESALEVIGHLTIAGKSRPEKIQVKYRTDQSGNLYVSGSKELKMTDYGVTPPEVMMGTIKTGNDITIRFDLSLKQIQNL